MVRHSLTDHNSLGNGSIEVTKIGFIGLSTYEPFPSVSGVQQQQVDGVHVYVAVRFRYFLPGRVNCRQRESLLPTLNNCVTLEQVELSGEDLAVTYLGQYLKQARIIVFRHTCSCYYVCVCVHLSQTDPLSSYLQATAVVDTFKSTFVHALSVALPAALCDSCPLKQLHDLYQGINGEYSSLDL